MDCLDGKKCMDNNETIYLSEKGFERLKKELSELKSQRRKEIAERLEYAKGLGDLSENAEYQEATEEQYSNESRIAEVENMLRRALPIPQSSNARIALGATITLRKSDNTEVSYKLVSSEEANPSQFKISDVSPIGRAIFGKERGAAITVFTPRGPVKYTIANIK